MRSSDAASHKGFSSHSSLWGSSWKVHLYHYHWHIVYFTKLEAHKHFLHKLCLDNAVWNPFFSKLVVVTNNIEHCNKTRLWKHSPSSLLWHLLHSYWAMGNDWVNNQQLWKANNRPYAPLSADHIFDTVVKIKHESYK